MPYGQITLEAGQVALVENVGDEAHVLDNDDLGAVADCHARRLLAAVLQGVHAVERQVGHLAARGVDAENPTGLPRRVVVNAESVGGHALHSLTSAGVPGGWAGRLHAERRG